MGLGCLTHNRWVLGSEPNFPVLAVALLVWDALTNPCLLLNSMSLDVWCLLPLMCLY